MRKQRHESYYHCPVEAALDLIGGKWKAVLLFRIIEKTRRFNELRRIVPKLTARMLTLQLRELEADGLVTRTIYPQVPPKVEYSPTQLGRSFRPVLEALIRWSVENRFDEIDPEKLAELGITRDTPLARPSEMPERAV